MAATELLQLIDLSLGGEPCGVVNFNYMHTLMHEIVRRLVQLEGVVVSRDPREGGTTIINYPPPQFGQPVVMVNQSTEGSPVKQVSVAVAPDGKQTDVSSKQPGVPGKQPETPSKQPEAPSKQPSTPSKQPSTPSKQPSTPSKQPEAPGEQADSTTKQADVTEQPAGVTDSTDTTKVSAPPLGGGVSDGDHKMDGAKRLDSDEAKVEELGIQMTDGSSSPVGASLSRSSMRHPSTTSSIGVYHTPSSKSRPHMISASNELVAMERKISELENRLGTVEALPDLLERKGVDASATPIKDMWQFTSLTKRLDAAEDGIHRTSTVVDEILGQLRNVMEQMTKFNNNTKTVNGKVDSVTGKVSTLEEQLNSSQELVQNLTQQVDDLKKKLTTLEGMATAPSGDDRVPTLLSDLQEQLDALKTDVTACKDGLLDMSQYVKWVDLDQALNAFRKTPTPPLPPENHPSPEAVMALQKVGELTNKLEGFLEEYEQLQSELAGKADFTDFREELAKKVNISDLSSLMPQGDGSDKGLLPMVVELQAKLTAIEADLKKQPSLPADVMENINSMQSTVEQLLADMGLLSSQLSTGSNTRLEELGSQVAQVRERLNDMDQALMATANAIRSQQPIPAVDSSTVPQIDSEVFNSLQSMVTDLQQQQERLLDTAANISHELGVNQDHVKALYSGVDELRNRKADKEQLQIEVDEKADRDALDSKASKQWVDSTFVRLDKEIREARSKLEGQELALKSAVDQLSTDVDGKLDRMEINRFQDYLDKKLRAHTAPSVVEKTVDVTDEAAGFKRRLKAKCISCDKPVGILPTPVVPNLPSGMHLPGVRSFRPYTTYELELIRQHQRLTHGGMSATLDYSGTLRSCGGSHTTTHPHRKIRVAPLNSVITREVRQRVPNPHAYDEMNIIGHDGQMYRGRFQKKLPNLQKLPKNNWSNGNRPPSAPPSQA